MDFRRWELLRLMLLINLHLGLLCSANLVLDVKHKFGGRKRGLGELRAHDALRHARLLSAISLPLGGNGLPSEAGLYFAKIGLGTPSQDYYVQVDTGSDILWVNCAGCNKCPTKSDLGVPLKLFDPKGSSTAKIVACDQDFCEATYNGQLPGCKPDLACQYNVVYGDGSSTAGYFVEDAIQLNHVSGNFQTSLTNGSIAFGCGAKQSGTLGSANAATDGILGFGQSNSSMISQLATAGKVKKVFAHCLDSVNGGGIFTIGQVVQPKVNTTPLVPNQQHYNVIMKAIEVGGDVLQLPTDEFDTQDQKGTIIDSGTTLAYLPEEVYDPLISQILAQHKDLKLHTVEDLFQCFQYIGNVDDGFPDVTFHFANSLTLTTYPHDYLFQAGNDLWCLGWMSGGFQTKDGTHSILLGDLVLSNRLVIYDLEKQTIGWTEYNCSSNIKLKDDQSGGTYSVAATNLNAASRPTGGRISVFLLALIALADSFFT
uniref:Peptidase A1 domain-containing protein n=1 Tax=Kalanchoe fedtschenkoi TaxID=63787 RepID=A0A7N0TZG5_KALFE